MNWRLMFIVIVLLTACGREAEDTASTPIAASAPPPAATKPAAPASIRASTLGTIDAIDTAAGTITIAHEAVPALEWPAMTMAFNAEPRQIEGLTVGQRVQFEFLASGADATITTIAAAD